MDQFTEGALIFAGIVIVAIWVIVRDRVRYPRRWCSPCRGSGERRSALSGAVGPCMPCGGTGRRPRAFGGK